MPLHLSISSWAGVPLCTSFNSMILSILSEESLYLPGAEKRLAGVETACQRRSRFQWKAIYNIAVGLHTIQKNKNLL